MYPEIVPPCFVLKSLNFPANKSLQLKKIQIIIQYTTLIYSQDTPTVLAQKSF